MTVIKHNWYNIFQIISEHFSWEFWDWLRWTHFWQTEPGMRKPQLCPGKIKFHLNLWSKVNFSTQMKVLVFSPVFLSTIQAQGCYWDPGSSGQNLRCLPDFYVKGGCESGSRNDCRIDGKTTSFGMKCCPADKNVPLTNRDEDNCTWTMLNS